MRGEAHCEELPIVASSAGGDDEVGKWETWTPQPIMCGTQVNVGESSLRDITNSEIGRKITEFADQLNGTLP